MENGKRRYKRERRYGGGPVTVALTVDMKRDLEREADRDNVSLAALMRRCLVAGLPRIKAAARKRRTRGGTGGGTNSGTGATQ